MPHVKTSPYSRVIRNIQLGGYALYGVRIVSIIYILIYFNLFLLLSLKTKTLYSIHTVLFDFNNSSIKMRIDFQKLILNFQRNFM